MKKTVQEKRMKIVVGINSLTVSQYPAYSNHIQVFYRLGRAYPHIDFCLVNPPRMSIDRMRNMAAVTAMEVGAKYLLFLDDDVLVPQPYDFLNKLMNLDVDIAAGDVLIRGYPFNHMLFKYRDKDKQGLDQLKNVPKKLGRLPVDAVGFSLALIKTELLLKMNTPYFITGVSNTEDIYFCVKARQEFPETTIAADTSIVCGHILWPEVIDAYNKVNYKKYHEAQFGKPQDESKNRGPVFLGMVKKGFEDAQA